MTALETIAEEFGAVEIRLAHEVTDAEWTVTLMHPRWIEMSGYRYEWWDHAHGSTLAEAADQLLMDLRELASAEQEQVGNIADGVREREQDNEITLNIDRLIENLANIDWKAVAQELVEKQSPYEGVRKQ